MKLSVLANLYGTKPLDYALKTISRLRIHTVEIGVGGYPGKDYCNPAGLLADEKKYDEFVATFKKYDIEIHRAWVFRTVGYRKGETYSRDLVSNIRLCVYDRVLSIEHEDSLSLSTKDSKRQLRSLRMSLSTKKNPPL